MTENNIEEVDRSKPIENAWSLSLPSFSKGDMKHSLQEESKFQVLFPKYKEKYLKQCWPFVENALKEYGIKADIDLIEGSMSVATTRKTWDPYVILKARDVIKLLGRSVPAEHAIKVLKDDTTCEIIKIKGLVRNKAILVKRRQRLIGSNGTALKALELLTDCYILIQGCTVSAIGPHKGVQQVLRVVKSTMRNIHPVNLLKVLMVQRSLAKDPEKKDQDWSKYIPSFAKTTVQRKKPKKIRVKKSYTPFPPERPESKKEANMSEGQFFIQKEQEGENRKKSAQQFKYKKAHNNKFDKKSKKDFKKNRT